MKVGDEIIVIEADPLSWNCIDEYRKGKKLEKEIAKIITYCRKNNYTIEFINCPHKQKCRYFLESEYCGGIFKKEFINLSSLKLKKFIKRP